MNVRTPGDAVNSPFTSSGDELEPVPWGVRGREPCNSGMLSGRQRVYTQPLAAQRPWSRGTALAVEASSSSLFTAAASERSRAVLRTWEAGEAHSKICRKNHTGTK